ncbi:MAG: NAD(P)/FAD-dependent oxidoreductase, partial [Macromonas sp.]
LEDALALAQAGTCASVTLLHRIDKFRVEPALEQALRTALAQGQLQLVIGQPTGLECEGEHLTALEIATNDGSARLPLDALLPRLGLSPKLGPVADWGLAMERKQLCVSPETFATSEPGIFAVGDINTYPGKRKLIVCGFHEATLAAFAAAAVVRPEERVLLQYTTSSPRLHALLGVS